MDRLTFRQIHQEPGLYECRTSGSTGTAVVVQKYEAQRRNFLRHVALLHNWHELDPKAITLQLRPGYDYPELHGNTVVSSKPVNGNFKQLMSYPSLFPEDLSKFDKIISYGEAWTGVGIDLYSSEEFGYIAIQCPFNKEHMHVMSNLRIRFSDKGMLITDLTHPYLKDYEIGDYAEPVECGCRIPLPAITHVKGRIRNMIRMPDGTTNWPCVGLYNYMEIKRFQVFQETLTKLRVHIDGIMPPEALDNMRKSLGYDFDIEVVHGDFKPGKFEEFISELE